MGYAKFMNLLLGPAYAGGVSDASQVAVSPRPPGVFGVRASVFSPRPSAESLPPIRASQRPINCTLVRILVQDRVRRQRWRSADALTPAARRKRLFGVDRGEQLLHGTRRRRTERLVEVDYLRKLLADQIITPRELAVAGKHLLDTICVVAAQRPCRVPRQQSFDLVALWLLVDRGHGQPLSIPAALSSSASSLRAGHRHARCMLDHAGQTG